MHSKRRGLQLLVLLLAAPLLGLVGVIIGELVPDGRIGYHLLRAEEAGILTPDERTPSLLGTTTDHYSECVAITVGLGDADDAGLLDRALRSPAYYGCEQMEQNLRSLAEEDLLTRGWTYLRYWHGYAVITRPAIGLLGLAGARWLTFAVLAVGVGGSGLAVRQRFGPVPAAMFVTPALLTTDMIVGGLTLSQSIGMSTAWFAGWLALLLVERDPVWRVATLAGAAGGVINAYFDLMTTIPGSLALTAAGAALGAVGSGARGAAGSLTVSAVAGWGVGILGMWVAKWVIAAAVLGVDEVERNVRHQIEFRLSGDYEGVSPTRTRGLTENLVMWWDQPLTPWVVAGIAIAVVVTVLRSRPSDPVWQQAAACGALIVVPTCAFYLVLNNHSQIHSWLVYRSLPMALGAAATVVTVATARTATDAGLFAPGERSSPASGLDAGPGSVSSPA